MTPVRFGMRIESHRTAILLAVATIVSPLAFAAAGQGGPPPTPVRVEAVHREEIARMRMVTGELHPLRRAAVATREPGVVIDLPVNDGQRVSAGDVLVRLDTRRVELEIDQAEADAEVARAAIDERQAEYEWRQADLELLRSAEDVANKKELLDADAELAIAKTRLDQSVRAAAAIDTRLKLLQQTLADKSTVAPFDGVVIAKRCELGEWMSEGDPVVDLLATDSLEAWLRIPQSEYDQVAANQRPVTIRFDATDKIIEATEFRVLPDVDPQARTFVLVATVANSEGHFASGMSVVAWIPTADLENRLTVPKDAVQHNDSGTFVYVARTTAPDAPATAMLARVEIRFPFGDRYVVDSGEIAAGDLVIVEGNERLFPMAPVIPIPRESSSGQAPALDAPGEGNGQAS